MTARTIKPAQTKVAAGCPICGTATVDAHRPFCSKRCAQIDLGRWLKGGYAVPGQPVNESDAFGSSEGERE